MSNVFGFLVMFFVGLAIFSGFLTIALHIAKRYSRNRRAWMLEDRNEMLRTIPQIGLEQFKVVVESLGWVVKSSGMDNCYHYVVLPKIDFANMLLIGHTFGSILKNWEIVWQGDDNILEVLACNLENDYPEKETEKFLEGIARVEKVTAKILEQKIEGYRQDRIKENDRRKRMAVIDAGLKAAGVKK